MSASSKRRMGPCWRTSNVLHTLIGHGPLSLWLEVIEMSNGVFCVYASGTAVKTVVLPQSVPDFSRADGGLDADDEAITLPLAAMLAGRPSFEGSVLRH